jgi:hypothetical protein
MESVKSEAQKRKQQALSDTIKTNPRINPQRITDLIDKIDIYLEEMRDKEDKIEIPNKLSSYIWGYFRNINPDKEKLKVLVLYLADHMYRYAATASMVDDYTRIYFASVITELWDTLQSRGVDTFYILDNELREDRFMFAIQLFALSGVAVVTPYMVKGNYHKYMNIEEQAKWALSFTPEDFDPKKVTITMDSSEDLRNIEVTGLIKKYMEHTRNIAYIEKDARVNYLDEVKKIARNSEYMCIFRNKAPDDPHVTVLSDLDENVSKQMKD